MVGPSGASCAIPATVAVFLAFTGVLAAWGALEPWSS